MKEVKRKDQFMHSFLEHRRIPYLFIYILLIAGLVQCSGAFSKPFVPPINDILHKQFLDPPAEYGMVPFYWWTGEPLSRERIAWQLDQLKANGFSGVNINYTHTSLGHSYRGDPPLFTKEWWRFWEEIVSECAKRDMAIGFDDYIVTHGHPDLATVGSRIRRDTPDVAGLLLRQRSYIVDGGETFYLETIKDSNIVAAAAYRLVGEKLDPSSAIDLLALSDKRTDRWKVPQGKWYVSVVYTKPQPFGAMNPLYAQKVIEHYFEQFNRHSKGQMGKAVDYFFQDELTFGGRMPYWCPDFPREFKRRKDYALLPELTALFMDIGPRTPKIRLDYYDVATALMEKAYFRPIFDWCENHGVLQDYAMVPCAGNRSNSFPLTRQGMRLHCPAL
jgi:hypothetical protein